MWNTNKKIGQKLSEIFQTEFEYRKETKSFHATITKDINQEDIKKIRKTGLYISEMHDEGDNKTSIHFKKESQAQKWTISTLSFTLIMVALEFAYIASKIEFYIK